MAFYPTPAASWLRLRKRNLIINKMILGHTKGLLLVKKVGVVAEGLNKLLLIIVPARFAKVRQGIDMRQVREDGFHIKRINLMFQLHFLK